MGSGQFASKTFSAGRKNASRLTVRQTGRGDSHPHGLVAGPAAHGESPAAFGRRCIPPGCVAPRSNTPGILARRALPKPGALLLPGAPGATPDFHHGLQA